MKKTNKKAISNILRKVLAGALVCAVFLGSFITGGFAAWQFSNFDVAINPDVGVGVDSLSYNVEKHTEEMEDVAQEYDVYFLAQHINILDQYEDENGDMQYRYLDVDEDGNFHFKVDAGLDPESLTYDERYDSHGLYYITPEINPTTNLPIVNRVTSFDPRLGCWSPAIDVSKTANSIIKAEEEEEENYKHLIVNAYQKFEGVSHLTADVINNLGTPTFSIRDGSGTPWPLSFLDWTLDYIQKDYDTTYYTDNGRKGAFSPNPKTPKGNALPILPGFNSSTSTYATYDPITGTYPAAEVLMGNLVDVSIYTREDTAITVPNNWNYFQVYGLYPNENFEIAHLSALLESYDSYSITIDGRKCLFFLPIYSTAKDTQYNTHRREFEKLDDCIRITSEGDTANSLYTTFDCEMTDLLKTSTTMQEFIDTWALSDALCTQIGLPLGSPQGWEKTEIRYKCYRISNRLVTPEMVQKNLDAKTVVVPGDYTRKASGATLWYGNLTVQQEYQLMFGDYLNCDVALNRQGFNGSKMCYLQDIATGEPVNINYKEGMYNIYIFVRECFADDPSDRSRVFNNFYGFSNEQIAEINSILASKNINVDKAVNCKEYKEFVVGGWSNNDARGYYVVFEEIVTPIAVLQYGGGDATKTLDFTREKGLSGSYMSVGGITTNVDDFVDAPFHPVSNRSGYVATAMALTDFDGNPITMTYPYYYMSAKIAGESSIIKQNAGKGPNSPAYNIPVYQFPITENTAITKNFKGSELLETIAESITKEQERSRIKVVLGANMLSLEVLKQAHDSLLSSKSSGENVTTSVGSDNISIVNASGVISVFVNSNDITSYFIDGETDLYQSIVAQMDDVYLLRARKSGVYRVGLVLYKNPSNEYEFDLWLAEPKSTIVTIYDKRDFGGIDPVKDVEGIMTSREWMANNHSFVANYVYDDGAFLVRGNIIGDGINVELKYNEKFTPSALLSARLTNRAGDKYITIDNLLRYYELEEATPKCLYDRSTGRYITYDNWNEIPFRIHGDIMLEVVDIPPEFLE